MSNENPYAYAFPSAYPTTRLGMGLRDYFAAQALPALLTNWKCYSEPTYRGALAAKAYEIADAMLAARNVPSDGPSEDPSGVLDTRQTP